MFLQSQLNSATGFLDELLADAKDANEFDRAEEIDEVVIVFAKMVQFIQEIAPEAVLDDLGGMEKLEGDMETLRQSALRLHTLNQQKLALKAQMADVNIPLEKLRKADIPNLMEALQVRTATFQGLGRVQLAADLYASTKKGQKDNAIQWLEDCGYEDMIKRTYNMSSIKALFRRMLVDGSEIPEAIFSVTPFTRASIVKA